jgi:hypothetical protein
MAYPTVSTPYGLIAINRIDGMPYAGAIRQIPAISGNAVIAFGDAVSLTTAGGVDKMTDGTAGTPCGVAVGCQYTNTLGQTVQAQYLPASATNGIVYVVDDPMALFKVAVLSSGTTVSTTGVARTVVGSNMALIINSSNTTTGDSRSGIDAASSDTTNTLPVRVIDVVPATQLASGNYVELLVKLNTHQYNNTTGV